jgi:tetratricopeptide (TPR) repeat protein
VYVSHIDLLTRLELFLRRHGILPIALARDSGYSRQHLLRVRLGEGGSTRRLILAVIGTCKRVTGAPVTPGMLFERADVLLAGRHHRLGHVFLDDLGRLNDFLTHVSGEDWAERVVTAGLLSETVVRHLLREGEARIDRQPREAAAIFVAATGIATRLPDTEPELAASLQGHARRGRANALRHLAEFDEALAELALAGHLFLKARYCANEAGRVEYSRAGVLFAMERWPEARSAAQGARRQFVTTGDARRAAYADLLLAAILFDEGDVEAARDTWLRLRTILDDLGDSEALARVWQNLGACEIRLGHAAQARHWLRYAAAAFRSLNNRTELTRTQWNIASYIARFRGAHAGIRALQHVEQDFTHLGAFVDAGCVGLDAIELMIENTIAEDSLTRYAEGVASVLVCAGLGVSAATALDQLRRIAQARDRSAVVTDVRLALRDASAPCRRGARDGERTGGAPGPTTATT